MTAAFWTRFEWITKADRWAVYRRDNFTCQACSELVNLRDWNARDSATLDHIVPQRHGGTHDLSNLRLLCRACNASKGARV